MDKVWLVTGSASGLGRNIAEAVLESGDRLVATARDPKRLGDLVKKYGDRVRAVSLDVADESAAQAAVQVAHNAFGRLDVVVNNAGFGDIAPFEQLSTERFKAVIDTNFYGVVNVTRAAVPHMAARTANHRNGPWPYHSLRGTVEFRYSAAAAGQFPG
jgi:NAD(P)-dependent dehydrogenase (short-subunit alcohol dehydrogenase family)